MRLATRFGLSVTVAAILTAAALGTLIHHTVRDMLEERAIEAQLAAARNTLHQIDHALHTARRDIQLLAEDEFLQAYIASPTERSDRTRELLTDELAERAELTGPWDAVMVLDRQGNHLLTAGSHGGHGNIADYPDSNRAFQTAMSGQLYHSDLLLSDHGDDATFIFAAPIRDDKEAKNTQAKDTQEEGEAAGQVIGVMLAHYQWSTISALLGEGLPTESAYLFNREGRVIAENIPGQTPPTAEHFSHHTGVQRALAAADQNVVIHPSLHGSGAVLSTRVRQAGQHGYPNKGWGLLVEQPVDIVFAPAGLIAWQAAIAVTTALAFLALALTLISRRLTRPLDRLTQITAKIGEGQYEYFSDDESDNEVGALARSFNTMVGQLESRRTELVEAKNRFQRLVDTVSDILYTAKPDDLRTTYISPAIEDLLGFTAEEFLGDPDLWNKLLVDADREATLAEIGAAMNGKADFVVTYRLRHKDGETVRWFEDRGSWELDESGRALALHGVMADVTERKQKEEQLARTTRALDILHTQDTLLTRATTEQELVQGICDNIVDKKVYQFAWVGQLDLEGAGRLHVTAYSGSNTAFAQQLGKNGFDATISTCPPCRAIRNQQAEMIQNLSEHPCADDWVWQTLEHDYASLISLPLTNEGSPIGSLNIYSRETDVFDAAELHLLKEIAGNLAYGITALRTQAMHNQAREQLAHQAFHDALTGLPNRAMFMQSLSVTLKRARESGEILAVLFIDLDDFKLVNDTLGHAAGDDLLRQVGARISSSIRGNDMVARQGGDEFLVLMSGVGTDNIDQDNRLLNPGIQAQRLIERLREPFRIEGQLTYIGASIGIAICPHDACDADTLLRYADSAMYRAKEMGLGSYAFYSAELTERQHQRMSLANQLHQALENKQFLLYYQPVIELASGRLAGVEALIRWQNDEGEIIQPGEFLPIAEDTGLIIPIGDWVLEEACRQIKAWQAKGLKLPVAINLSARQLWHSDIADTILNTIAEAGVSSDSIEVEITETAMSRDPQHMEAAFIRFHQGGLKIALDDFGTGYSSLSRLKQLPISTLKIDRSFVDGIPDDEDDTAIVHATMQLAHSLGLRSLAEGIETKSQWEWLRKGGCQYGQGFYFSHPVPAGEIESMMAQGRRWEFPPDDPPATGS